MKWLDIVDLLVFGGAAFPRRRASGRIAQAATSFLDGLCRQGGAPLIAHVAGGPPFDAGIANSFTGANITALVVAVLLLVTYPSPVLRLVPLTVIGVAEQVAAAVGVTLPSV